MTSLRIAQVAERTGVPATTLRYYEEIDLLPAARSPNGYRTYGERDLERLAFISRAKRLHISLSELRELVQVWDDGDCSTVAHSVAEAVSTRLAETTVRLSELSALATQLRDARERLTGSASAGPCGPGCPCVDMTTAPDTEDRTAHRHTAVGGAIPVSCALSDEELGRRVAAWQHLLTSVEHREDVPGGLRLRFAVDADRMSDLGRLVAAEQDCCPFFAFTMRVDAGVVTLDVVAPPEAADLVAAVFGPATTAMTPGADAPA